MTQGSSVRCRILRFLLTFTAMEDDEAIGGRET